MSQPTLASLGFRSRDELLRVLGLEIDLLGSRLHELHLHSIVLLDICGTLNLAIRHPAFPATSRAIITGFLDEIVANCKARGLRAHAALLELSRNPANDVTIRSANGGE